MNETRTVGDLLERFIADLDTRKAPNWWETFYRNEPTASTLASEAMAMMGGRTVQDLSVAELKTLDSILARLMDLAATYAAGRGELVPSLPGS